ncbi:protein CutA homolog [Betta splendens]|uniref:Protein CutA homolog n=1 Tax=Betta splendens TaxID=158456 RepID=A0A6P7P042_BETSP|nr:protein CutA homolog [Betta splendens]
MVLITTPRMELLGVRCVKDATFHPVCRSLMATSCVLAVLSVSMYPGLSSLGVRLHSALTGAYLPGHYSVLLINSPNEQTAKDIGSAIMEKRLAASVNMLFKTSTMYYWKGEIQEASEILMLLKIKTSTVQQVTEYVRSIHPYENPEVLSFRVEDGSLPYMKWMDEAIRDK